MTLNSVKVNDIVTLVTHTGEIVGRLTAVEGDALTLADPRLFVSQAEGSGLAPGICMTGEMNPKSADFFVGSVVAVLPTASELQSAWQQATSGLVIPS